MTNAELIQEIEALKAELAQKDTKIAYLIEQFRLAQQKRFGKSSEGDPGQGELFTATYARAESRARWPRFTFVRRWVRWRISSVR